jgi:hypothetical protein
MSRLRRAVHRLISHRNNFSTLNLKFHFKNSALDIGQRLVIAHRIRRAHARLVYAGSDDVDAVQCGLLGDIFLVHVVTETAVFDVQFEVLGDLVPG